jgi:Fe-Mn family superoxide dismutase
MEIHHGRHYKAYVDNYNKAISEKQPDLDGKPLHEVLANNCAMVKDEIKTPVRNNGGGAHNHALFWEILNPAGKPGTQPVGKLAEAINSTFGSFDQFKEKFNLKLLQQLAKPAATAAKVMTPSYLSGEASQAG